MANNIAFQPMGKTVQVVTANTAANNVTMVSDSPCQQYRLASHGANPVYVWISPAATPANVSIPTGNGANAGYAIMIPPNSATVITGPQVSSTAAVQVSARSETGTPEIYVTPGEGL